MKTIPILMYHQIDVPPPKGSAMRGLVVAPRTFFWHMACLWLMGYRGLSMGSLEPYLRGERQGRVFGITFDDGYSNNLYRALPILQRFGFSSTCYVVVGLVGQHNSWDAPQGIAQVPLMDAAQLQQWVDAGQEVGSHTMTHARLPDLAPDQQQREIAQSKQALEALVQQQGGVRHFCYPYGLCDVSSVQAVQNTGYTTATTTKRGRVNLHAPLHAHLLLLPRVLVSRTTTWAHLLLKCFTAYEDRQTGAATNTGGPVQ
ncbi:MAG: polysaccharide deacetylase family protein [Betaproteobacteria bacterium]